MKAKSLLSIVCYSTRSIDPSINDVGKRVCQLLRKLSKIDVVFKETIHFNGSKESKISIDNNNCIDELAKLILKSEWENITKYEGNTKPTLNYKRQGSGFNFNSFFHDGPHRKFVFNFGCGYLVDGATFYNFNKNYEYDYEWYKQVFNCLIDYMKPFYASVFINNQSWSEFYKEMGTRYPIGWITYFSDSYEICIPDDLRGVRYEFVNGGKYLYTSDVDFMKDKEAYFSFRENLKVIIREIKERVPEFGV